MPDKEKIAIEVFYSKDKEQFTEGLEIWKKNRKKIFNEYGWDIIFLDETQVNEKYSYLIFILNSRSKRWSK